MIEKVRIRDLTTEKRVKYCDIHFGKNSCSKCPFAIQPETKGAVAVCMKCVENKWMSDEFLDQEVEIEVPDILTKEEKEWLKATIKLLPFKTGKIRHCKFREGEFIIMFTTKAEDNYADLSIKYDLFQKMEINQYYTLEDLGL